MGPGQGSNLGKARSKIVYFVLGAAGLLIGSAVSEISLSLYGLALGLMAAEIVNLWNAVLA